MTSTSEDIVMRFVRDFAAILRLRRFLTALGYTTGIAFLFLALVHELDTRFLLPPWARLIPAVVYLPIALMWRRFTGKNPVAAAAEIERRDSRFGEKLQTVVSQVLAAPRLRASDELIGCLAQEMRSQVEDRRAASLVPVGPIIRAFVFALVAAALAVITEHAARRSAPLASIVRAKPQAPVVVATMPSVPTTNVANDVNQQTKPDSVTGAAGESTARPIVDQPPMLLISHPRGDAIAAVGETCEIAFDAADDVGIAIVSADVTISAAANGRARGVQLQAEAASPLKLSMSSLSARAGDIVVVTMQARDAAGQTSTPQTRRIIVSSKSPPLIATLPLTELREANQASQALIKVLELVAPQLEPNAPRTSLGRALAAAVEASAAVQTAVVRFANSSPSDVGSSVNDSAQVLCDAVRAMRERLGGGSATEIEKAPLAELVIGATQLNQQIATLTRGVAAAILQAQLKPRELAAVAIMRRDIPRALAAMRSAAARAPALVPLAQELGLDSSAADLSAQVSQIVAQGEQLARSFMPPKAVALVGNWMQALLLNSQEARSIEHRLAALARSNAAPTVDLVEKNQPSAPTAATQPTNLDQVPPNSREAVAAYFQALARDAAAALSK